MGEEQEQKFHQLTEEPVSRVISHLAVPCIISMLAVSYTHLVNHYSGKLIVAIATMSFPHNYSH